jgi:hypothetical protein
MVSDLFCSELLLLGRLWLGVMLHDVWPSNSPRGPSEDIQACHATPHALPRPEAVSWPHPHASPCGL